MIKFDNVTIVDARSNSICHGRQNAKVKEFS